MQKKVNVVIFGAGPAGLGAAARLQSKGYSVLIIDRASNVGGAAASFKMGDCIVDYGPHAFHLKKKEIIDFVRELAGADAVEVLRKSQLILDGKLLKFPLDMREAFLKINFGISFKILTDYWFANIKRFFVVAHGQVETFESWGIAAFGKTLYRLAFGNYSERMWGVAGSQLSASLARQKLLKLNLAKIVLNLFGLGDRTLEGGVTALYDLYPRFGIGTVFDRLTKRITSDSRNELWLDSTIDNVELQNSGSQRVFFHHGDQQHQVECDAVISSIPIKYLSNLLQREDLSLLGKTLRYRDVRISYIVLNRASYSDAHWIYLLDSHFRFNRVSEQKNLNKESCPDGKTVVSLDIACDKGDAVWEMSEEAFFDMAMEDLSVIGLHRSDVVRSFSLKLQDVYPVYDLGYEERFDLMLKKLGEYQHLYSIGRQGLFLNNDIHDSIDMGFLAADQFADGKRSSDWYEFAKNYIALRLEGRVK